MGDVKKSLFGIYVIFSLIILSLLSINIVSGWQLVPGSENSPDGDVEDALMCDDGYIAVGLQLDNRQNDDDDDGYTSDNDGIGHTNLVCAKYSIDESEKFIVDYSDTDVKGVGDNVAEAICPQGKVMIGVQWKNVFLQTGALFWSKCSSLTWVDAYAPICAPYDETGNIDYDEREMLPNDGDFKEMDGKCDQSTKSFEEPQECQDGEIAVGFKETLVKKELKKRVVNLDRTVSTSATVVCQAYAGGTEPLPEMKCEDFGYLCKDSCDAENEQEVSGKVCSGEKKCCREVKNCSSPDLTLIKLSDASNSHASLFDSLNNYPIKLCYSDLFGTDYTGTSPHDCTEKNTLVYLDKSTNAHGSFEKSDKYSKEVCYGDLNCRTSEEPCSENEIAILSLTNLTNGMFSLGSAYKYIRCCKTAGEGVSGCGTDNFQISGQEECDGTTMPVDADREPILECSAWGDGTVYTSGKINCSDPGTENECRLDFSDCVGGYPNGGYCGDGIINQGGKERCDGTNLGGMNCGNFNRQGVGLRCSSDCKSFDFTFCVNCLEGTTLCDDGTCKASCGVNKNCDNNETCDIGEGCECPDCHGYRDSCINSTICDYKTKTCQNCSNALIYLENINPIYSSCSFLDQGDPAYITITITGPTKGTGYSNWPRFKVGDIISFNQTITSTRKDVNITWIFGEGDEESTVSITNCLTSGNCNTSYSYSKPGHYVVEARVREIGGNKIKSDFIDVLIYQEGYNPFAIITQPSNGQIFEKAFANFNANESVVVKCDLTCASGDCTPVGTESPILQCYDLPKPGSGTNTYNFWFEWTFDKGLESQEIILGTWNQNYSEVVEFNRSFSYEGDHTASLRVGYEAI